VCDLPGSHCARPAQYPSASFACHVAAKGLDTGDKVIAKAGGAAYSRASPAMPTRTVRDWLSRIDKDSKEARNKRIFAMWMACYTEAEMMAAESCSDSPVKDAISSFSENLPKNLKAAAEHATDFDPPIYNIWKQQTKTEGSSHFGNSEVRWLDNLLYLYTKPFDVVVDPTIILTRGGRYLQKRSSELLRTRCITHRSSRLPKQPWYSSFPKAFRWGAYIAAHVFVASILIGGIYLIQHLILLVGDPNLYDRFPLRYVFDTMELGVIGPFLVLGTLETISVFRKEDSNDG
jgi:hypothetical protein